MVGIIRAKVEGGRFHGQQVDFEMAGPTSKDWKVLMNGNVVQGVTAVYLRAVAGQPAVLTIHMTDIASRVQ
jgi:hypothetical protein